MSDLPQDITPISIEEELKQSYLDYAMSVIVGRALPDVRDGLKPVHRRVLFAMHELGNDWNKAYKKSARVVGDVIGKYHPHGDTAVYDAIVRMAQPFSLRYMLVDGQGNFGSIDGDAPAAMRYTEVRLSRIAHDLMADLEKETVDWVPNYDETESIPAVMPTRVPNLLVNGSSGIAVGMATNIPPHNLTEVVDACLLLLRTPDASLDMLMQHIHGPDFPTFGIINGRAGIVEAYRTGRGRVYVRARTLIEVDEKTNRQSIIIIELPYQVNKARLIEKIAALVKEKVIEGIAPDGLRDESDKDGMRVVLDVKRGESAEILLNNLYAHTQMESVFGINMVALVDSQPKLLNLYDFLSLFLRHRREVVIRRTIFELRKARNRGHIIEGQAVALANIDAIIELIRNALNPAEAKVGLMGHIWPPGTVLVLLEKAGGADICRPEDVPPDMGLQPEGYRLTAEQAQAILDLRLHRLTGLEQDKLVQEYQDILEKIKELSRILNSPERLQEVVQEELQEIRDQYGDKRRTEIMASRLDLSVADLIPVEDVVFTVSHTGYAKIQPVSDYRAQRRGGRGRSATAVKEEDYVDHFLVVSTHDTVLCFTTAGRVFWLKVYEVPQASRGSKGKPLVNMMALATAERVTTILPLREYPKEHFILMATADGTVKRVELQQFSRQRSNGLIAIDLVEGDTLIGAVVTDGSQDIMLFSAAGKVARFLETNVRSMGRQAVGVRGIRLDEQTKVVSVLAVQAGSTILTASRNGFGKQTKENEFSCTSRGVKGVIAMQITERNGNLVAAVQISDKGELMLISDQGTLVRTRISEISVLSRNTQGVMLMRMAEGEHLVGVVPVDEVQVLDEEIIEGKEDPAVNTEGDPTTLAGEQELD